MRCDIVDWNEIKNQYIDGAILLGNGASIAVDPIFSYESLLGRARERGFLTQDVESLFSCFNTSDFELILRMVWHATNVNEVLGVQDKVTQQAYENLRSCLVEVVRDSHSNYQAIQRDLPYISNFLKDFETVLSLNYDLIVYWAMMYNNRQRYGHIFKDCFNNSQFRGDWWNLRQLYRERANTLVFYPHGNLALCRDYLDREWKTAQANSDDLLGSILATWEMGKGVPLFVSEGTQEQKIRSIQNSYYLSVVYREVLTGLHPSLTIYGWGFGDQDRHLLEQIAHSNIERVAISVYRRDEIYCHRALALVKEVLGGQLQVDFFDSASPGCWKYSN